MAHVNGAGGPAKTPGMVLNEVTMAGKGWKVRRGGGVAWAGGCTGRRVNGGASTGAGAGAGDSLPVWGGRR